MFPVGLNIEGIVNMRIVDFAEAHIEQAAQIALHDYHGERRHVPSLPPIDAVPDLTPYTKNGLGVAALEDGKMIGFLCAVGPFDNAFRSTDAVGVFSPLGANGAVGENRANVYARLYQAAGEKWMRAGAASHAVCLFAHDIEIQQQFFQYSFGLRCIDAVRGMESLNIIPCEDYEFVELEKDEHHKVFPLDCMLNQYQCTSPYFLRREPRTLESFMNSVEINSERFFAAKYRGVLCAFLMVASGGDTFIADEKGYADVGSAFCLPEHRGKGVYQNLLDFAISVLRRDGYIRLGVDFESYNPTAYGFWLKYFDAYAHSVVRRIDEDVLTKGKAI